MKFLKVIGIIVSIMIVLVFLSGVYVKAFLPNTGPASDVKIEGTPERIERGKYLANHVTVCIDCHSGRDWSTYAAPMVPGSIGAGGERFSQDMGFPGVFYARNITPHAIGNWTDGELLRAITTGVNKNEEALFPLMAYPRFGKMDQEDVYSIIAYIRTLKPIEKNIPERSPDFPVSFLINTMPEKAAFTKRPPESDVVNYGAYMANAAGCVECHSKQDKGTIIPGSEFGGGMEFRQPGGLVRSPNITADKETGLGNWTAEIFISRFKMYADSAHVPVRLKQGDLNTPMPWYMYAGMKTTDLEAIYAYLKQVTPISNKVVKFEKN